MVWRGGQDAHWGHLVAAHQLARYLYFSNSNGSRHSDRSPRHQACYQHKSPVVCPNEDRSSFDRLKSLSATDLQFLQPGQPVAHLLRAALILYFFFEP
jgi:hypothetical protein